MKRAILFICRNIEKELNSKSIIQFSQKYEDTQICFADNNSTDRTVFALNEIKNECKNVTVVTIKHKVALRTAKRAGARYIVNRFKINQFGYLNLNDSLHHFASFHLLFFELDTYFESICKKSAELWRVTDRGNLTSHKTFSFLKELQLIHHSEQE